MSNLARNIAQRLEAKGWTQADLAGEAKVEPATISRVMNGTATLVAESLGKLAKALDTTPAALLNDSSNVSAESFTWRKIPILDYIQAGRFTGVDPLFRNAEMTDFVVTAEEFSADAFGLVIRGDSMLPEFRTGDVVIIDPAIAPQPEDFVVAKDDTGEATFKRFHRRGIDPVTGKARFDLVPLNSAYETLHSAEQELIIVGTMLEHHRRRRR